MITTPECDNFIKEATAGQTKQVNQLDKMFEFITNSSEIPFLVLDKTFDAERVKQEIAEVESRNLFVRYYSKFADFKTEGWYATALFGQSATNPWNAQNSLDKSHVKHPDNIWTETAECMPYMLSVIDNVVGLKNVNRCVCFKLLPGGFVNVHTDEPETNSYSLKQVNFHIQWPDNCNWYIGGDQTGIHPTKEGSVTMHSSVHPHAIVNNSNKPRYFIWAFANFTPEFKKEVVGSYINTLLK